MIHNRQLSTKRLFLRPLHQGDAEALCQLLSAANLAALPSFEWARSYNIQDSQAFIAASQCAWQSDRPAALCMAVLTRRSMRWVGVVDVHDCCWEQRVGALGICLSESAQGQGYATEIGDLLCGTAAEHWGFRCLRWCHHVSNVASARLAQRLGFALEVAEGVALDPIQTVCYQKVLQVQQAGCY